MKLFCPVAREDQVGMRVNQARRYNGPLCVNNSDTISMGHSIMLEHWFSFIIGSYPDNTPVMYCNRRIVYHL